MGMRITMVRYTVRPGRAEENAALVRDVYAELRADPPDGLRYATFRSGDDFVHLAALEDDMADGTPLTGVPAFGRFQEGLRERCSVAPQFTQLEAVGQLALLEP
jgi:hypothetical protein